MTETVKIEGRTIDISSPEKVLFPAEGITKRDVVEYYRRMAETMLPYMRDRPLTMHRFPNGIEAPGFYQKEAPDYFPDWIERVPIEVLEEGRPQPQVICQDAATLIYLASQSCLTPHIWLSRADKLDYPDKLIFDLDPPENDFDLVRLAARTLHALLEALELVSFVMTTGSKGLHVVIPLDRSANFDRADLHSQRYTMRNIFRRLARKRDPWQGMTAQACSLGEAQGRLDDLGP